MMGAGIMMGGSASRTHRQRGGHHPGQAHFAARCFISSSRRTAKHPQIPTRSQLHHNHTKKLFLTFERYFRVAGGWHFLMIM